MTPEQLKARQRQLEIEALALMMASQPPPGIRDGSDMFLNPATGQETSRELLRNNVEPSQMRAATGGAMQGAGYQYGDEVIGALSGGFKGLTDPENSVPDWVNFERERTRATLEADAEAFPKTAIAGEVIGAVGQGLSTASALGMTKPASLGTRLWQGAALGGGEGALYGSGRGEGQGRVGTAMRDGALGLGVGLAAPLILSGGKAVLEAGAGAPRRAYDHLFDVANSRRAGNALAGTVEASGQSVDDVSARIASARAWGQPEFSVVDALGDAGRRQLNAMTRSGGEASQEITDYLLKRQSAQPERIASFLEDAFDMRNAATRAFKRAMDVGAEAGDAIPTASRIEAAMKAARSAEARRLYEASRQAARPVNLTPAIDIIDTALKRNPILGDKALVKTELGKRLLKIRKLIADSNSQLIDYDTVLNVKIDTGETISKLMRKGPVPPQLGDVLKALDAALEQSSDGYRAANDAYRAASREIDAIAMGSGMARPSARAMDVVDQFSNMTGPERAAAKVGYGDTLLTRVEGAATPTGNRATPLTSPKMTETFNAMATDPDLLAQRLANENDMHRTMALTTQGSRTADNTTDLAAEGGLLSLFNGAPTSARGVASSAVGKLLPMLTGKNPATRKMIADALLSQDATRLLPGVKRAQAEKVRQGLLEILMRGASRPMLADQ